MRARDLGIAFDGQAGRYNAITDVAGVEVGHATLIRGHGPLRRGEGPVRTGVTIVHPRGRAGEGGVVAGRATINGTGEWTGMHLVDEIGRFFGPVALTGTGNLGLVHQAMVEWSSRNAALSEDERYMRLLAVVGETLDAQLNDVFGRPMTAADVFAALDGADGGPVAEGNVGGGTGMVAYEFKGGIGTASRVVKAAGRDFTVGVLLQANHARRNDLRIAGIPVGEAIADLMPGKADPLEVRRRRETTKSSLLIVLATDAPLQAHQLQRLARRAALGVGRCGSTANSLSGELALAFSTTSGGDGGTAIDDCDAEAMNALFAAAVQAVEEALINQLCASTTLDGPDDVVVHALPLDRVVDLLDRHGRLRRA